MINWKYPKTQTNNWLPWYVILKRLLFSPIIFFGLIIIYFGLFCSYGKKRADKFWTENW